MTIYPKEHIPGKRVSIVLLAVFLIPATSSFAQQRRGATPQPLPGAVMRERSRTMDEYDRALNLLRNDARARAVAAERRRNNFPQINEDFQRIQVIHNEMVRMLRTVDGIDHSRLKELSGEMKSRSSRLRTNLGLPEGEKIAQPSDAKTSPTSPAQSTNPSANPTPAELPKDRLKASIISMHDTVASFVGNSLFKNLGVVDVKAVAQASSDLTEIIHLSDEIKKNADAASKTAKQK